MSIKVAYQPGGSGPPASDEKAKVSANDTTAGYLNGKLVAGTGITLTENNDGGNETLTIANSAPDQTVSISGDGNISIGGTYPSFSLSFTNGSGYITSSALTGYALLSGANQPFTGTVEVQLGTSVSTQSVLIVDSSRALTDPLLGPLASGFYKTGTAFNSLTFFNLVGGDAGTTVMGSGLVGDTARRLRIYADGKINWGDGASGTLDTNLYRSAADTLKTDDNLDVSLSLTVAGLTTANGGVLISQTRPTLSFLFGGGTTYARVAQYIADNLYITQNADFNGSTWNRDDVSKISAVADLHGATSLIRWRTASAGANPITLTTVLDITRDGYIRAASGTNSAPTFSNNSDSDTGIYFPSSNTLAITTGGTQRVVVTSAGAVQVNNLTADTLVYANGTKDLSSVTLGTGLSLSSGTLSNTAPDQTVTISGDSDISVSGTYPSFTLSFTNGSGFLTSESDPVFTAWLATPPNISIFTNDSGYLTSFTELDPVFTASDAFAITSTQISNWDTAFGWGDHAGAGYAKIDSTNQPFTSAGQDSLSTADRLGYDSAELISIDWDSRNLRDTNVVVLDWANYNLNDQYAVQSINWNDRRTFDSGAIWSIDYGARELYSSGAVPTFDWQNLKFPTLTTDGFLTTTGGDGTISVDTTAYLDETASDAIYARLDGTNQPFTGNLNVSKSNPKLTLTDSATDSPTVYLEKLTTFDGSQLVSQNRRFAPANAIAIAGTTGTMASPPSLTTYSFSCWYWSDNVSFQSVFCNGTNNINFRGQGISPPYIRVSGFGGSTIDFVAASGQPSLVGRWTHIVYMRNAATGQAYMYYDGVASPQNGSTVGTTTISSFTVPTTTNGRLDEFIVYDKILSAGEIAALYNSGAPVRITNYTNVLIHWSADQASGTTLTDNSGNGRNVTGITGSTWITGKVSSNVLEPLTDIPLVKILNNGTINSYGDLTYGYYSGSYGTSNIYDGLTHVHRVLGTTRLQVTSSGITVTGAAVLTSITASTLTISGALTMSGIINGCTQISVTNGFYANAGLVGTPSHSFSSDTNTGMYSFGADQLGFSTGGSLRLHIGSTGLLSAGSGSAAAHSARLDLSDGNITMLLGANSSGTARTNSTDKLARVSAYHYTNAEEPTALFLVSNQASSNFLGIGGGSSLMNAVTDVSFYAAATTTTVSGSVIWGYGFNGLNIADGKNIVVGSTTGTKIGTATSQKLSLWNQTPDVQPTTAITAASYTHNSSTAVHTDDTFDGYTLAQVVAALRRIGALA